ncbi:MAG: HD domain-containing protein [Tissierellia bacterium]|nr:HD domain-containing protein [Tissierellia bacterium]
MEFDIFKDLAFVVELEKMKSVLRRTKVLKTERRENDAEHSWHIATMSLFLSKYYKNKVNVEKVIKMLLIHDLVEIYAGDTFAYDVKANEEKHKRELLAVEKIKGQLTFDNAELFENLWIEFESKITLESKFANSMDRLQPILTNINDGNGGTWREFGVTKSQILKRIEPIKDFNDEIYAYLLSEINKSIEKGHIINT